MSIQIKFFGVRGSAPIADKKYLKYGGNTSSITVRTPENSLLFLDAGSGLYLYLVVIKSHPRRPYKWIRFE
jgi:hypothetical protein